MKKLFIIGPFRNEDHYILHQNCLRVERVSAAIWSFDAIAYPPHLITRHLYGHVSEKIIQAGHLEMLALCDGAVILPTWKQSGGSIIEVAQAQKDGQATHFIDCTWEAEWILSTSRLKQFIDLVIERNPTNALRQD